MRILQAKHLTAALAAVTVFSTSLSTVHAIDRCKVKVDKRTGVILVDASGVGGPLTWGEQAGAENNSFFNTGTCVTGDKAKKCQLADPLTVASKTAPAACTLYLDDTATPCSAWIPGCSPGVRRAAGAVLKDSNGLTIGVVVDEFTNNVLIEAAGRTLRAQTNYDGTGFLVGGSSLYYASNDCSGPVLASPDSLIIDQALVVTPTLAYAPPATGVSTTFESLLVFASYFNNQTDCDTFLVPGTTFTAPHGCCVTAAPTMTPLGPASSIDLSAFVPPFEVELLD